ncbi:MAG: flagellar basal body P-ring protein FlgI, partial [Microvirgula sp.]
MNRLRRGLLLLASGALALLMGCVGTATAGQRIKDLARFDGWRDNPLVGFGLVTGLAGSGDSSRSQMTRQTLSNLLNQFDVRLASEQISSRNVAAAMVTATLPPLTGPGNRMDVTVTAIGDARSLVGGTLLLTALKGSDGRVYSLAQGPVSVGGYRYDGNGNVVQKNHPTVGRIAGGGIVERAVPADIVGEDGVSLLLNTPDFTTSNRIAAAINRGIDGHPASSVGANRVRVRLDVQGLPAVMALLSRIEAIEVEPDERARVVVNERTGTVVAGGNVTLSPVTVMHGELKVSIASDHQTLPAATAFPYRPLVTDTVAVPRTRIAVDEQLAAGVSLRGKS